MGDLADTGGETVGLLVALFQDVAEGEEALGGGVAVDVVHVDLVL